MKLYLESLGCARNQVDSEIMTGRLKKAGWTFTQDPEEAETIVVNTCSFIEEAAQESIDVILELAEYKKEGRCKRLVVTGCLPERYREEILSSLPEVDVILGTGAFEQIAKAVREPEYANMCVLPDPDLTELQPQDAPRDLTVPHVAYLKIAEGCSKSCTYCIIPKLRGKQKSRQPEDIVAEATRLIAGGVNELVLVAQDTTAYGNDLPTRTNLSRLMESLVDIRVDDLNRKTPPWFRVLYGHPESIENSFIEALASHGQLCSYFDIPVQHVSSGILKHMGRRYAKDDLYRLFNRIRKRVPDAVLRTTIIVGFPGETDEDFQELLQFVEDVRFDHLGVFIYSDSDDLASHRLPNHIPKALATDRYHELMSTQSGISTENNRKYIGKAVQVLVEESLDKHLFAGRTNFQAPEVDGLTYINTAKMPFGLKIGGFVDMRVTDTMEYDLMGEPI
ncbi:MAG: 30S ribosomal protein S12 methylthiotransferase RimO [Deltaproteobacteria bacterium]|jgi:ribosomal protein S12 methylthiotransferase|nr:30S ribosomal protein S12 methylthiotransferase RimO [Deltaproteobacteria bacterium]MBW2479431.1 30S ribosomal protein S12 methylthiotransferase RimO [Deltaproteobacteria bacterium]